MKLNFIKNLIAKTVAKQLRKPGGMLAGKVGNEMNKTNGFLYDFTVDAMRLQNDESILEIEFGNGSFFNRLFSAADNLKIAGLDFSPEMVKEATAANATASKNGTLTLKLGSSDKIPFPGNSFDKVFCINVIYFWEQPAEHLKEIFRVLKPGGKFYTAVRTKETLAQMPFANYGFSLYTQDEWADILENNRFRFVHSETSKNEPDAVFGKQRYKAASVCIVAEKDT